MAYSSKWLSCLLATLCCLFGTVQLSPLEKPTFVEDTPVDGNCISVPFGTTWTTSIVVQSDTRYS